MVQFGNFVRSVQLLAAFDLAISSTHISNKLRQLRQVQSINFHHDAITGTHNRIVGEDYDKRMVDAIDHIAEEISQLFLNQAKQ